MIDLKDPRITQYVLNEMNETEKAQFETEMQNDQELQAAVDDFTHFIGGVKSEMAKEPLPATHVKEPEYSAIGKWFLFALGPVAAAAVAALIFLNPSIKQRNGVPDKLAGLKNEKPQPQLPEVPQPPQASTKSRQDIAANTQELKTTKQVQELEGVEESLADDMAVSAAPARMESQRTGIGYGKGSGSAIMAKKKSRRAYPGGGLGIESRGYYVQPRDSESYDEFNENDFKKAIQEPLSTFSIDVDTASYTNIRRFVERSQPVPKNSVRIEEMINYFNYSYAPPQDEKPFSVHTELTTAPWNKNNKLLRIGLKGKEIDWKDRKSSNLVFLIDVSGSMNNPNKLPLVKQGLKLMVENMDKKDRMAIVVYAGSSGLVLPSTPGSRKEEILAAFDRLSAGGSTNGGAGIQLAYQVAQDHFIKGGINRVILATDGDFNVGTTSRSSLIELIKEKAKSNVFLTVLGFGTGNLKDSQMEALANKGNGQYAYIDSYREGKRVLVEQIGGTLMTIAKDVKIQVDFNPSKVEGYRLIGYVNRLLNKEDFNDDKKDAGEIGAGHTVTALYEIVPKGGKLPKGSVQPSKYIQPEPSQKESSKTGSSEWLTVRLRYKQPEGSQSTKMEFPVKGEASRFEEASTDTRWAAAVANFGMILRDSSFKGDNSTYSSVIKFAEKAKGEDKHGRRQEMIDLLKKLRN